MQQPGTLTQTWRPRRPRGLNSVPLVTRAVRGRIPLVRLPQADEVHRERAEGCHDPVHLLLRRSVGRVSPQSELVPPALLHALLGDARLPPGHVTVQVVEATLDRTRNLRRAGQLGRAAGLLREQPLRRLLHRAILDQRLAKLADVAHDFQLGATGIARGRRADQVTGVSAWLLSDRPSGWHAEVKGLVVRLPARFAVARERIDEL
mmetsp:Transcript_31570/g.74530  ORF Transcript_31570/g.74530 Transcript_31570/m.74530 type:complete len:206 (+) Transcript_31570:54-671(+)